MKILKLFTMACLLMSGQYAFSTTTNFQMFWGFTNSAGTAAVHSYNDICKGGQIYIKNLSTYSGTAPTSGTYDVWRTIGNSQVNIIASGIPASAWPIGGVYAITVNNDFNYVSTGLNIKVVYNGPMGTTYAGNGAGKYNSAYLRTVGPPVVDAGPDVSFCQGATVSLTASGASTYSWSPGGSTSNPLNILPSATTTFTVTGSTTYSAGYPSSSLNPSVTCSATDMVTITMLTPPHVPKSWRSYSLCTSDAMPLLDAYGGSNCSYQWFFTPVGGSTTSTSVTTSNINTSAFGYGYYTVIITDNSTGCSASYSANVVLDPSAAANLNADFASNDVVNTTAGTITFNPTPAVTSGTHSWTVYRTDNSYNIISTLYTSSSATWSSAQTYSPYNDYYMIKHTITSGPCYETKTLTKQLHYDLVGKKLEENISKSDLEEVIVDVNVFPNPNNGQFTVQLGDWEGEKNIEVYDMIGRKIFEATSNDAFVTVDLSNKAVSGTLIVKISDGDKTSLKKISVSNR